MTDDQPRIWVQKNYASFNGIRGLAVLLVFLTHFLWIAPLMQLVQLQYVSFVGVDLFFVLSGFLITGILYDSLGEPRYFKNFYIRRALRIFPLFYGVYLLIYLLKPVLHLSPDRYMPAFALYVGNFLPALTGLDGGHLNNVTMSVHGRPFTVMSFGHLWSLCVEEQFYLVWPAVVWLVRDRVRLMRLCSAGAVLALLLRLVLEIKFPVLAYKSAFIYAATYTRFDTLLIGSWFALLLRGTLLTRAQLRGWSMGLMFVPGTLALVGGLVGFARYEFQSSPFTQTVGFTLIALAGSGFLLLSLDDESWLARCLRFKPLARLGIVSYGFYVIHGIPAVALHQLDGPGSRIQASHVLRLLVPVGWFCATWTLAECSFRLYETPFLRLKSVYAPQANRIHLEVAAAAAEAPRAS